MLFYWLVRLRPIEALLHAQFCPLCSCNAVELILPHKLTLNAYTVTIAAYKLLYMQITQQEHFRQKTHAQT